MHTYIQTNLYSAKIVETNQRCWRRVMTMMNDDVQTTELSMWLTFSVQ